MPLQASGLGWLQILRGKIARVMAAVQLLFQDLAADVVLDRLGDGLFPPAQSFRKRLHRIRTAMDAGRPLPMALRENRVWGVKEKLMERVLPLLSAGQLVRWLDDAHTVDGIVKGLKAPDWPADPWQALQQMAMRVATACAVR